MKLLFDFLPVILFFVAFKLFGIYVATSVAIAASLLQAAYLKLTGKKIDVMMWVSLAIIIVAGGATLLLHDERFIKWKPTLLYWAMGAALVIAQFILKKNALATIFKDQFDLPRQVWNKLTLAWIAFFSVMGLLNLFIAFNFPTEIWVNFKVFGGLGLMMVFVIIQALWLAKYLPEDGKS